MESSKSDGNKEKEPQDTKILIDNQTVATIVNTNIEKEIQNILITNENEQQEPCCSWRTTGQNPALTERKQTEIVLANNDSISSTLIAIDISCPSLQENITRTEDSNSCSNELLNNARNPNGAKNGHSSSLTNLFDDIEGLDPTSVTQPKSQVTNLPCAQSSLLTTQQAQTPNQSVVKNQPRTQSPVTNQPRVVTQPQVHPPVTTPQRTQSPVPNQPPVTSQQRGQSLVETQPRVHAQKHASNRTNQSPTSQRVQSPKPTTTNQHVQLRRNPEPPPTTSRGIHVLNIPNESINYSLPRADTVVNSSTNRILPRADQVLGPPPSYSKSLLDRRVNTCASIQFVAPIPPPSYDGMENELRYAHTLGHTAGFTLGLGNTWQGQPQPAYCPVCETVIITQVDIRVSRIAHIFAMVMFLLLCWPFCLLPYFLNVCNYTFHYCSVCHSYLGGRRPFQRG